MTYYIIETRPEDCDQWSTPPLHNILHTDPVVAREQVKAYIVIYGFKPENIRVAISTTENYMTLPDPSVGKRVIKYVNFNGREVRTEGTVVAAVGLRYLVSFSRDGVEFRGWWLIRDCVEVDDEAAI